VVSLVAESIFGVPMGKAIKKEKVYKWGTWDTIMLMAWSFMMWYNFDAGNLWWGTLCLIVTLIGAAVCIESKLEQK
jgi:hypothetical protein